MGVWVRSESQRYTRPGQIIRRAVAGFPSPAPAPVRYGCAAPCARRHKKCRAWPGRVMAGNIERLEVVVVVFDLGPSPPQSQCAERKPPYAPWCGSQGESAGSSGPPGQRDVDGLARQLRIRPPIPERLACANQLLQFLLYHIDLCARCRTLFGRQLAQPFSKP